jgi:hypothetical protein
MKPSEEDFVNEGLSADEITAMNSEAEAATHEEAPASEELTQDAAPDQAPQEPKMVDVRAVQEARAEARAAREEIARIRSEEAAERGRLQERIDAINAAIAKQNEPPPPKTPGMEEDPIAHIEHRFMTQQQKLDALEKQSVEREQAAKQEYERNLVVDRAGAYLNEAIATKAEVQDAFNFAVDGLRSEIAEYLKPYNLPPERFAAEAEKQFRSSLYQMAQRMPANPVQAAEYVMRNARYYGYGYQAPQQTQQTRPTPQQLQEKQDRHMSLSNISGGEAPQALSLESIAKMSDADFHALAAKIGDKGLDKLMGAA